MSLVYNIFKKNIFRDRPRVNTANFYDVVEGMENVPSRFGRSGCGTRTEAPVARGPEGQKTGRVRAVLRGRGVGRVVRPPNRARGHLTGSPPGACVRFYAVRGRAGGKASLSRPGIQ